MSKSSGPVVAEQDILREFLTGAKLVAKVKLQKDGSRLATQKVVSVVVAANAYVSYPRGDAKLLLALESALFSLLRERHGCFAFSTHFPAEAVQCNGSGSEPGPSPWDGSALVTSLSNVWLQA